MLFLAIVISTIFGRAVFGDNDEAFGLCMKLEKEWTEECMKNNKCPPPGLQKIKSKNNEAIECIDGFINVDDVSYPCNNMELLSFVPLNELGSTPVTIPTPDGGSFTGIVGSDIWGYKDEENDKLYALTCQMDGASIVDVTNPFNPIVLAFIPSQVEGVAIPWRDIKVYKNYMYIGADFGGGSGSDPVLGDHGLQYFNLDNLPDIDSSDDENEPDLPVVISSEDIGLYTEFNECHNIIINEDSGYLYAVGTDTCNGGLHIIDINDPGNPTFVTCFEDLQYIHDGQCVTYSASKGDNKDYYDREYCFTANTRTLTISIIDVTDKSNIRVLSTISYGDGGARFTHQLWITPNYQYLLLNDELDEFLCFCEDQRTRTYIFDITDFENPVFVETYYGTEEAIAHNLYIDDSGNYAYLSNYQAGLRILDISGLYGDDEDNDIAEVAYFDSFPDELGVGFGGIWSSYIYFKRFILIQTMDRGLFVLRSTF